MKVNNGTDDKDGTCIMTILFMVTSMIKLSMINDEDEDDVLENGDTQRVPSTT